MKIQIGSGASCRVYGCFKGVPDLARWNRRVSLEGAEDRKAALPLEQLVQEERVALWVLRCLREATRIVRAQALLERFLERETAALQRAFAEITLDGFSPPATQLCSSCERRVLRLAALFQHVTEAHSLSVFALSFSEAGEESRAFGEALTCLGAVLGLKGVWLPVPDMLAATLPCSAHDDSAPSLMARREPGLMGAE